MSETLILHREDLETDGKYLKLSSLLVSEYHLNLMERLKDTDAYRGYLKNGCKLVTSELKLIMRDELELILDIDDRLVFKCQDMFEQLMVICSLVRPEFIGVIVEMSRKLLENPTAVMDYFQIGTTFDNAENKAA